MGLRRIEILESHPSSGPDPQGGAEIALAGHAASPPTNRSLASIRPADAAFQAA
jgi:hypothetical protein